jgi:hypothetical protein
LTAPAAVLDSTNFLRVVDLPWPQATDARPYLELSTSSHKWNITRSTYATLLAKNLLRKVSFCVPWS